MNKKFWKNKRVLVTGHEGFLGSSLVKCLLSADAEVAGLDRRKSAGPNSVLKDFRALFKAYTGDIRNLSFVRRVMSKVRPQIVFHLAAEALVGYANRHPLEAFDSNIRGTWNVLEACRGKRYVEGIVLASSDKAYGTQKKLPYTEDMPLEGRFPYDSSKSCADLLAVTYYHSFKLPVCVTRCGNIYGPGDLNFSRLVPDAMRSMIKRKRFRIRSNGRFTRDYIYIEDVVNAYIVLAEKMDKLKLYGQAFNFSNRKPVTVLRLVEKLAKLTGSEDVKPVILNQASHEIEHQYLSSEKAQSVLGWRPLYPLEAGLRQTLDWYRAITK